MACSMRTLRMKSTTDIPNNALIFFESNDVLEFHFFRQTLPCRSLRRPNNAQPLPRACFYENIVQHIDRFAGQGFLLQVTCPTATNFA